MNIKLLNEKIEHIKTQVEIVVLKNIESQPQNEKEILESIFFTKKSFNIYFNSQTNRLYVSCLKLKSENVKIAFYKIM